MLRNFANLRDAGVFHWGIGVQPFGDYPVNQDGAFFFEELDEALFFGNECAYSIVFATQRSLAVTSSGDRLYVPLSGSSSVALFDPIVLQQVDTQLLTPGVDPIVLPAGAAPQSIVISHRDEYAYIVDGRSNNIYVLNINPDSATYHTVIQTISVTPAPLGLRQMAISRVVLQKLVVVC